MKYFKWLMIVMPLSVIINMYSASAQVNGFQSIYFMNQYLVNPAFAGLEKGLMVNMGYRHQWTTISGAPKFQSLTADYNTGNKVGLGININNNQAGLISSTRVVGTYAYHLPLSASGDQHLNFGISFGARSNTIDYSKIAGDPDDPQVRNFNQQGMYLDGDFGISYTSNDFNVQCALPNLKNMFMERNGNNDLEVDRSVFYTAVSYRIQLNEQLGNSILEPKMAFRGVKGFDNIFDAGFLLGLTDQNLSIAGFYHTNKTMSLSVGAGLGKVDMLVSYTNDMGLLRTYGNNTFEIGLRLKLLRN